VSGKICIYSFLLPVLIVLNFLLILSVTNHNVTKRLLLFASK
jgi:cytochrome c oxidase subunit IV